MEFPTPVNGTSGEDTIRSAGSEPYPGGPEPGDSPERPVGLGEGEGSLFQPLETQDDDHSGAPVDGGQVEANSGAREYHGDQQRSDSEKSFRTETSGRQPSRAPEPTRAWSERKLPVPTETPQTVPRPPIFETCSEILGGGRILEIVETTDPTRTAFAMLDQDEVCSVDRVSLGDRVFVPVRRNDPILRWMHLPNGCRTYGSPAQLARQIGGFLSAIVQLPDSLQHVLGAFTMHTWAPYRFPVPLFPVLRAPRDFCEPLLQALALVCRHALVIADATGPALLHACSRFSPTYLILDFGLHRDATRILKAGLKPDVLALRQKAATSAYSPRLMACPEEPSDPELLSEAIAFSLPLTEWPRAERLHDPEFLKQAEMLRRSLLRFRLVSRESIVPVAGDPPPGWTTKQWSVFRWFAAPFSDDEQFCARLREAFQQDCEVAPQRYSPAKRAVLVALFQLAHSKTSSASVGEIAEKANEILDQMGEASITPRRLGAVLDGFGFPERARGEQGKYEFEFHRKNLERIHRLAALYGSSELETCTTQEARACCTFCREFQFISEGDVQRHEQKSQPVEGCGQRQAEEERRKAFEDLGGKPPKSIPLNVVRQEEETGLNDATRAPVKENGAA